jgi:hypothetical protein
LRETLETVERMTGRMPEEGINPVEMPFFLRHIWSWFLALDAKRGGGMGPSPITHTEMQAYFSLMRITPSTLDIETISRLDAIALSSLNKKAAT